MLKFSLGNKATDWTPAPEDSDASYSVILTNESQVIPTTTSLKPLSNSQYTTQVIAYQGTKQQTNFKIKPLVAKDGITPSINGDTITFSVNKNTFLNASEDIPSFHSLLSICVAHTSIASFVLPTRTSYIFLNTASNFVRYPF